MSAPHPILTHLAPAMLVMVRLGGLTLFAPVLGAAVVPVKIKALLVVLLGVAVYPLLAREHLAGVSDLSLSLWTLGPIVAVEVMIGLVIGYLANLPLVAAQTGGLIMGQQMGLGFATFYNPAIEDESDVLGQMLFFMALGGFLVIGGHEAMILAVLRSFEHVPLGGFIPEERLLDFVTGMLLAVFELALRVAAPLLALIFLESLALGFVSKTVPQLNILSLGFPLRILIGLLVVALGLVAIDMVLMDGTAWMLDEMLAWADGERG